MKKVLPVLFFVILAIIAIGLKNCNNKPPATTKKQTQTTTRPSQTTSKPTQSTDRPKFDRTTTDLFFTKHARCRMKCRHISQDEVRDILVNGTVNYNKSDLDDSQGPTYALEGVTKDRQHVRIIFAPKQKHLSVVTVIDLDSDYQCDC